jgi:hypothetical protein
MTGTKQPQQTPSPADALAKTSPEASIELSESALDEASGGAFFKWKLEPVQKIDTDPALLLPAVKPAL